VTKQSSGEFSRENAKARLQFQVRVEAAMPKPTQPPGCVVLAAEMGGLRPSQNLKLTDGSLAEVSK
jgi:hypothetical protein